ncbi:MAG: hypothetical protein ACYTFM_00825 [Planctomycetota bacterium]|jgi:hypothetical protein
MNIKGILNFFEDNVEKIVLGIAIILSIWLLLQWVIISPNNIEYQGKTFIPGSIDKFIYENEALSLNNKMNRPSEPASVYEPQYELFVSWFDSPLSNLNPSVFPSVPGDLGEEKIKEDSEYNVPQVGEVTDAIAEHIRAVAYIPKEEVTTDNPYDRASKETKDIDIITVEAKFDTSKLLESFYNNFAGIDVPIEWQDPCAAQPIFVAVDLQRSQLLADSSWGEWERVPRQKIEENKELFTIIENVKDLPSGGLKLRKLRYDSTKIARSLLQPDTYSIASPKEEWFPPQLHTKYNKVREDIERDERRKAAEEAENKKSETGRRGTSTLGGGGTRGGGTRGGGTRGGMGTGGISAMFSQGSGGTQRGSGLTRGSNVRGGARDTRGGRQVPGQPGQDPASTIDPSKPKQTTVEDIEKELNDLLITNYAKSGYAKIFSIEEPLVFWAIDDTVQPDQTYRYKIRLGVLNPKAGTGHFTADYKSYQDKVVLWSEFSSETDPLGIPSRLYFFPLNVQEETKSVDIQISKYVLGYWHSEKFPTKPGEVIGNVAKPKPLTEEEKKKGIRNPREVNYNTGAILVDVVPVNTWVGTGNLNLQNYNDLLYSLDEENILRIPVKSRYWTQDMQRLYNEINQKVTKEPLRDFGSKSTIRGKAFGGRKKGERKTLESFLQNMFQQEQ